MKIVLNTSPIIFPGKINCLHLLENCVIGQYDIEPARQKPVMQAQLDELIEKRLSK